jgi:Icc protein
MTLKIVQISDLHLFADPDGELKGLKTQAGLTAVLSDIRDRHPDFDLLVISGDHTHDELPNTYRRIRRQLGAWVSRTRLIPGNHDERAVIREVFPDLVPASGERLTFEVELKGWRLLGIDSHVPGQLYGEVGEEQWEWLAERLGRSSGPALLFLHHPPLPIGSPWMDAIGLRDAEGLKHVVRHSPQLKLICHGHIHQEFAGSLDGVPVRSAPSTAIQFRPQTRELQIDDLPPGYRVILLQEDGTFSTEVVRPG